MDGIEVTPYTLAAGIVSALVLALFVSWMRSRLKDGSLTMRLESKTAAQLEAELAESRKEAAAQRNRAELAEAKAQRAEEQSDAWQAKYIAKLEGNSGPGK